MTNPFKKDSAIAKAFEMAAKGTTRDALNKMCEKEKLNAPRIFHCLRRGTYGESKWKYQQDSEKGTVKLVPGTTAVAKAKAKAKKPVAKAKATKKVAEKTVAVPETAKAA